MLQEQTLQTVTLLPRSHPHKEDRSLDLVFDEKLYLMRQELQSNLANTIKVALNEAVTLFANQPALTNVINPEALDRSVQQALEKSKEFRQINNQLGR
jgi:hypothetical protein